MNVNNYLYRIRLETSEKFTNFTEYDAGVNIPTYTTTGSLTDANLYVKTYFTLVRRLDVPNNQSCLDYYINGELMETSSGSALLSPIPNDGTGGRLFVCGEFNTSDTLNMQQFRLMKRALTPSEIQAAYQTGLSSSFVAGEEIVTVFRGVSGSNYIYYRSDEETPNNLTDVVAINSFVKG